ncbi:MAG: integrase core domain-containing protein [Chloroflexota bacterium]|nr:integrase core domain-containing protein [Chloroflexota bacterium]
MDAEERARRDAVRRVMAGERAAQVAAALGRTERWVFKWVSRYDPADEGWAQARSRAPEHVPGRSDPKLEALVLQVRARLAAQPWSQIGAPAIAWELEKLPLRQIPQVRTIERILERGEAPRRAVRARYAAKGTPYPAAAQRPAPNEVQEADLVGPRHLAGGISFYACNAVDVGRHAAACELQPNKTDAETAASLVRIWGRLGIPTRLKLDNWLVATLQHSLPLTAWLCLALGVIPVFVPIREPWRQGVIEHFNDTFDKRFFRTERFRDVRHLATQLRRFEGFHNTHHRYAAIGRATPAEFAAKAGFTPRVLEPDFRIPERLPRRGRVEFIRLVRSDRILSVLGEQITLGADQVHEYVTAILHVRRGELEVVHGGKTVKDVDLAVRG